MLKRAGVAPDAVTRVELPDTVGPFLAGELASAQMTNYHELHQVEERLGPDAIRVFSGKDSDSSILKDGLAVSARFVEENPTAVQAVVDAVLEGWSIAFREPERAIAACLAARPDIREAEHRQQLADIRALAMTGATLTHGLGYPDPRHVTRAAEAIVAVEGRTVPHDGILDLRFWQAAPAVFRSKEWN
jgi:ABC-type nitrate/sulfonate/bicarbonate transport system substrate-binding protein